MEGDCNSHFFHITTLIRRNHNKILRLMNDEGEWVQDQGSIKELVRDFFLQLYSSDHSLNQSHLEGLEGWTCYLLEEAHSVLNSIPSELEIKDNLFSQKLNKSPGPNGLNPGFFQKF